MDAGEIEPGYYQCDASKRTLGELWRTGPWWYFPFRLAINHLVKPSPEGNFVYLPIVPNEYWCAREDVPTVIQERLDPLIAQAMAGGFTVEHWSYQGKSRSVQASGMVSGGVGLYNGRDTICALVAVQGNHRGFAIDQMVISLASYEARRNLFHATKNKDQSFERHRRTRVRVLPGADFPTLAQAHRQRLDRLGDCAIGLEDYRRHYADMNRETWKARIDRGLVRRVCGTREELQTILAQRAQPPTA